MVSSALHLKCLALGRALIFWQISGALKELNMTFFFFCTAGVTCHRAGWKEIQNSKRKIPK